jgi:hypothetical protein
MLATVMRAVRRHVLCASRTSSARVSRGIVACGLQRERVDVDAVARAAPSFIARDREDPEPQP